MKQDENEVFNELIKLNTELIEQNKKLIEEIKKSEDEKMKRLVLNNDDVCKILKISPRTLQNYRDSKKINFSKPEKIVFYKYSDLMEFIERYRNNN